MKRFVVREYRILLDKRRFPDCRGVTLVLLSDLHGAWYGENQEALIGEIRRQRPDLIVSAGDLVTRGESPGAALKLMAGLAGRYPAYCANGNHESAMEAGEDDYAGYEKRLKRTGARVLRNEKARLTLKGLPLEISGLELGPEHYRRFHAARATEKELRRLLGEPGRDAYQVLIAHNPADFPAYAAWGADLVLSGHLHGGYLRLPLLGGVVSPQLRLFPKYDRGLFTEGKSHMIVSAGLGDHHMPFRIRNPRELPVIRLEISEKA